VELILRSIEKVKVQHEHSRTSTGRLVSLGHLRTSVLRDHDQLRRSFRVRVLESTLKEHIGWTATQFGDINAQFNLAYAIGFPVRGWLIDKYGTRFGYAFFLIVWSLAAAAHALARTGGQFAMARFALGLGESGNFPAAIKTVAEWFPKKERAFATASSRRSNIGAIFAPASCRIALNWGCNGPSSALDSPA